MPCIRMPLFCLLLCVLAAPAWAQDSGSAAVQTENVRMEYARVLRAEPVYQTLRATSMVERCEQSTPVQGSEPQRSGLARVVGVVKDVFSSKPEAGDDKADGKDAAGKNCRMVPVQREFQRPIAYDVDYVHHGVKYRSRLPYDPGNRVRVRVSVTPIVSAPDEH